MNLCNLVTYLTKCYIHVGFLRLIDNQEVFVTQLGVLALHCFTLLLESCLVESGRFYYDFLIDTRVTFVCDASLVFQIL